MNSLEKAMAELNKKHGFEIIRKGTSSIYVEKIPFSSPRANYMTYGGVPIGKATEFFGSEGGGKTTSALDVCGQAQKKALKDFQAKVTKLETSIDGLKGKEGKESVKQREKLEKELEELHAIGPRQVVYVDAEHTLDEEWAEMNGVDTSNLILLKPFDETAEQVLQGMLNLLDTGMVECMVLDSVPMLVSKQLFDETLDKKSYGGISGVMTEFSRKVSPIISKHHTALIIINQVREDFENPYNQYNTPGGRMLKHLYALRLFFRKGVFIDADNGELATNKAVEPAGNMVDITVVKTKVCKPDRRVGQYTIKYNSGIDILDDTVFMAVNRYGFIRLSGSWYYILDPETGEVMKNNEGDLKFQGKAKLLEYLREDEEMFQELYEAVQAKLSETA